MTREELKEHCERQVQQFERVEKIMPVTPNDWKRYEEHKLILELLEQETVSKEVYDHEYFLRKEFELKIDKLQRQLEEQAIEQEPTTKNNLGVDWENYKDVDGNSLDDLILEVLQNNFDCGNTYGYKVADEIIGLLPSVTPQEPRKGSWISSNGVPYTYFNSFIVCSECGKHPKEKSDFCPNCGSYNGGASNGNE